MSEHSEVTPQQLEAAAADYFQLNDKLEDAYVRHLNGLLEGIKCKTTTDENLREALTYAYEVDSINLMRRKDIIDLDKPCNFIADFPTMSCVIQKYSSTKGSDQLKTLEHNLFWVLGSDSIPYIPPHEYGLGAEAQRNHLLLTCPTIPCTAVAAGGAKRKTNKK